jgi:hypothetical protein
MVTETAWQIRPYQAGDEEALVKLFARVFQRPLTIAHWRWKLQAAPSPVANVWLAIHENEPIFQYAGIPTRCVADGRAVTGMVSVDTMTAPEFQRRGLLTQVGGRTYAEWRAAGISFVMGLPNERWGSRTNALGWVELFDLQWLARPLRVETRLARRLRLKPIGKLSVVSALWNAFWNMSLQRAEAVEIRTITKAGAEFDQLWHATRADAFMSVQHDRAWVQWRYLDAPALNYTVLLAQRDQESLGFAAWRVKENAGRRVGLMAQVHTRRDAPAAWNALWRAALEQMHAAGVETVLTLAAAHSPTWHSLRRIGFVPRHAFKLQIVPLDDALPLERLQDPANWNIAGGDFDVV